MLRLATRGSQLALWQAGRVAALLRAAHPGLEVDVITVSTRADRRPEIPIREMGGQGVFVREVQVAVLAGRADAAVHSAKDLQPVPDEGLCLAAVPERADPRDALVGTRLLDLSPGAVVATGSQRRRAQLAYLRPDLRFEDLRGNIGSRLQKVPPGGAILVAMAALQRLGLEPEPVQVLGTDLMLPQVAQGALAVECREDDEATRALLSTIDAGSIRCEVDAERSFLARIGGGCQLPVAGHASTTPDGRLSVEGLLASPDGKTMVRRKALGLPLQAAAVGVAVADLVLAGGGMELLAGAEGPKPLGEAGQ